MCTNVKVSGKFQHGCSVAGKMSESYYSTLDPPSQKRYNEKTELTEDKDPHTLSENEFSVDFDNFPPISYPDIINYLVFRPSPYSVGDMKAYKSLKAYNQVIEGWIRGVKVNLNENGLTVVKGKVGCTTVQLLHTTICCIFIKTTFETTTQSLTFLSSFF